MEDNEHIAVTADELQSAAKGGENGRGANGLQTFGQRVNSTLAAEKHKAKQGVGSRAIEQKHMEARAAELQKIIAKGAEEGAKKADIDAAADAKEELFEMQIQINQATGKQGIAGSKMEFVPAHKHNVAYNEHNATAEMLAWEQQNKENYNMDNEDDKKAYDKERFKKQKEVDDKVKNGRGTVAYEILKGGDKTARVNAERTIEKERLETEIAESRAEAEKTLKGKEKADRLEELEELKKASLNRIDAKHDARLKAGAPEEAFEVAKKQRSGDQYEKARKQAEYDVEKNLASDNFAGSMFAGINLNTDFDAEQKRIDRMSGRTKEDREKREKEQQKLDALKDAHTSISSSTYSAMDEKKREALADNWLKNTEEGRKYASEHVDNINHATIHNRLLTDDNPHKVIAKDRLEELKAVLPMEVTPEMKLNMEGWKQSLYDSNNKLKQGQALEDAFMLQVGDPRNHSAMGIQNTEWAAVKSGVGGVLGKVGSVAATAVNPWKMTDLVQGGIHSITNKNDTNMLGAFMNGLFNPDQGVFAQTELFKMMDSMSSYQTFKALDKWEASMTERQKFEAFGKARTYRFTGAFAENTAELATMDADAAFRSQYLGQSRQEVEKRYGELKDAKDNAAEKIGKVATTNNAIAKAVNELTQEIANKNGVNSIAYREKEKEINTVLNTGSQGDFKKLFGEDKGAALHAARDAQFAQKSAEIDEQRDIIRRFDRADGMVEKNSDGTLKKDKNSHEDFMKTQESRRNQLHEYMGNGMRVLGISDADKAVLASEMGKLRDPNGEYISAKRDYEAGKKPVVQIDGKAVTLDSNAAFAKFQKAQYKAYEDTIASKIDFNAVAFRDYGEKTGDRMDGVLGATMAGEQVKLMQDTIQKTSKESHQLFRDEKFVEMIQKSRWQDLADNFHAAADGRENQFDKNLLAGVTKKGELVEIGNMFKNMLGDANGEMRGEGFSVAQNVIARTFRMAFVDQITESLKATASMLDQQQLSAFTARDELIATLKGSSDSATRAMIGSLNISDLTTFSKDPKYHGEIERMQKKMQNNLEAQRGLSDMQRQSLQDKMEKLFSNTFENLRLREETDRMTYRIRELTELDFQARNAVERKGDKMQFMPDRV